MSDRMFYAGALVVAFVMIGLAVVWPQGEGARSPAPFGHAVVVTEAAREAEKKEVSKRKAAAERRAAAVAAGLRPAQKAPAQ
jgi:hypothetical protein